MIKYIRVCVFEGMRVPVWCSVLLAASPILCEISILRPFLFLAALLIRFHSWSGHITLDPVSLLIRPHHSWSGFTPDPATSLQIRRHHSWSGDPARDHVIPHWLITRRALTTRLLDWLNNQLEQSTRPTDYQSTGRTHQGSDASLLMPNYPIRGSFL